LSGKIFVNYRRGDAPDSTGRLYDRLESEFSATDLFMDVEGHIKPGDDFVEVLGRQVAQCDVLLAVIGPNWSDLLAARAGDPDDFVAVEIKAAIEQRKRVIPVLVGGAGMPRADTLPVAIRALARRNAVGLRPERFKADCQGLIGALKEQLAAAEQERAARTDAERRAAEAERQRRETEEAARLAAAEERARAQAVAGLSPEEVRKAEELANWDFIKERDDIQALRDHLARFPGGVAQLYATTKLDELSWAALGTRPTIEQLRAYLDEFPKGANAGAAQARIAALERKAAEARATEERRARETEEWGAVATSTEKNDIEAFLKAWPSGRYVAAARAKLDEFSRMRQRAEEAAAWSKVNISGDPRELQAFLLRWPDGQYAPSANHRLKEIDRLQSPFSGGQFRRGNNWVLAFFLLNIATWVGCWMLVKAVPVDMPTQLATASNRIFYIYYLFFIMQASSTFFIFFPAIASLAARVPISEVSVGIGPEVLTYKTNDALFKVALIPWGSNLKWHEDSPVVGRRNAYEKQTPLLQIVLMLSGPLGLFLLGWILTGTNPFTGAAATIASVFRAVVSPVDGPVALWSYVFNFIKYSDYTAAQGFTFIAIAGLNMLPVPMLTGGQVLMRAVAALRGHHLNERIQHITSMIGLFIILAILLIFLIGFLRFNLT